MHGVVFEIEIKINTPALDFPLIGVLTKHSSRRISVCLAPLNGGYKISSYLNYGTGHQRLAPSLIHQISFDQSDCARKLYFCNKYEFCYITDKHSTDPPILKKKIKKNCTFKASSCIHKAPRPRN